MHSLNQEELLRYSRHLPVIGKEGQTKLKNARVLCVGGGGLGCPALQYLAASGIGTLGIMDGDQIELSNLQRQILFTEQDIGRNKALVIGERLRSLNSHVSIEIYQHFLSAANASNIVADYDLVLDASDNYSTRYLLNSVCRSLEKPLISASIYQYEAQLSVFNYNRGPCYQCLYPAPPPANMSPNCSLSGVLGVLPGVAGCLQAMEAIKIILGSEHVLSGTLLSMDLLTMQFKHFDITKHDCTQHPSIEFHEHMNQCQAFLADIPEITASDLAQLLAADSDAIQLLDVREPYERDICHIGGTHMPLSSFSSQLAQRVLLQDKPIVVYCKSGMRSATVCQQLKNAGFQHISNLRGGIISWMETVNHRLTRY
ncbi:ThiF family adenylyltransferase [Legionella fallonii]|uniref:Molybdopterin-synthase adenylyltransferase n=1 Tax=Legionella fallonii LLAP-10 TaxID=1212491 RepID=A0A098FZT7_9GAMM|nr:ThiF family adenylyltransferase [Legionella fallonii]CEG55747.1 Adenylyltransferase and sulfurtransferase MOCS3 [Includes: Molybdopterin-synthase adenylyltransferase; Molybdopterin-synthase sulfurtransferase] [Legionella fallonii LLAP-10]